jgi:catechol 2,3-dioxygenase
LAYFTIVVPDKTELQAVLERVGNAGIPVTGLDGVCVLKDPSGIELRLITN